ncbi:MAG TPA: DNA gyrase inhibitor YacG [Sedimentisphaerales bacterium]|nr:DNA gyrase inhibitor YacG [Sedimentisphaerales bacterium]
MKFQCPICKKLIQPATGNDKESHRYFPFCSERCKLIDLGAWFDGEYKLEIQDKVSQIDDELYRDDEI